MKQMMKLLALLMIFMLLPLSAGASYVVDETTFNKTCYWRMTRSAPLYLMQPWHVDGEVIYTFEPLARCQTESAFR